jgi:hypothetical protein
MWGQGLKLEHQFARIAARRIADDLGEQLEILPGAGDEPGRGYARSGAKISSDVTADQKPVLLPVSGHTYAALAGDRADFALTFREYFLTDQAMINFLTRNDDRPAASLFGEIPATFPTVNGQVRLLVEDGPTDDVRLVILDGGANDAYFEEVIDPEGPSIDALNRQFFRVFQERLSDLLKSARIAFPNAVIIVTGYYSALSHLTHRGELRRFAEYYKHLPDWQVKLNGFLNDFPLVNYVWDATWGSDKDLDELLENAILRTVYAAAQVHFRTRATIGSLPHRFLGPGILYAHPNFLAEHALFAGDKSLVHSGYKPPNSGSYSVADEMLYTRVGNMPRLSILNDYNSIAKDVDVVLNSDTSQQQRADTVAVVIDKITALKTANSDLPGQILLATTGPYYEDDDGMRALKTALAAEIGRLERTFIASFVHPNADGAKRYADAIVTTHRRHRRFSVKDATHGMVEAGETLSLRSALPRHNLNPASGLRQLALVAYVESVAIELYQFSAWLGRKYVRLVLGADVAFGFDPPQMPRNEPLQNVLLAFDTGIVHLSQITELTVIIVDAISDDQDPVTFTQAALYLNGHEVFRGNRADGEVTTDDLGFSSVRFAFGTKTNT